MQLTAAQRAQPIVLNVIITDGDCFLGKDLNDGRQKNSGYDEYVQSAEGARA